MSGHSKWANIKHKKESADKKRGVVFTKLARAITVAAREGGGDPNSNFTLRLALDKARAGNMPRDNIDRAVARGAGGDKNDALERITYEGYGPHGSAILVAVTTDNRNRTVGELRYQFNKYGGSLGEGGSVAWQFEQRGVISIPADGVDPDDLALQAIDVGALDVEVDEEAVTVYTVTTDFAKVKNALAAAGYPTEDAELAMIPTNQIQLEAKHTLQVMKLADALEDLDDVDQVWSNVEITEEAAAAYEAA